MLYALLAIAFYNALLCTAAACLYGGIKASPDVLMKLYRTPGLTKYGFVAVYFLTHGVNSLLTTAGSVARLADVVLTQWIVSAAAKAAAVLAAKNDDSDGDVAVGNGLSVKGSAFHQGGDASSLALLDVKAVRATATATATDGQKPRTRKRVGAPSDGPVFGKASVAAFKTVFDLIETSPSKTQPQQAAPPQPPGSYDLDGTRSRPASPPTPTAASSS